MIGALVRVILGFVLASLMAGLVFVLFALPPTELASDKGPGLAAFADWSLKSGTQAAIFGAPFALIAAAIGEWQRLRSPAYYILAGVLIAMTGFLAQHSSETTGQHTVLNEYAIKAFLTSGFFAGLLYWLIAGRVAGEDDPGNRAPAVSAKTSEPAKPTAAKAPEVKPVAAKPATDSAKSALDEARPVVKDPEIKA